MLSSSFCIILTEFTSYTISYRLQYTNNLWFIFQRNMYFLSKEEMTVPNYSTVQKMLSTMACTLNVPEGLDDIFLICFPSSLYIEQLNLFNTLSLCE